ncbi:TRAP transporter substrate-binding protein DctP [Marinobacter sp. 71-i]|uniref:TRAP transporter substrate-binding protein DctP n=1 Tax=Marinobacter iranensis TaxID=2962607 RepID=A0ABT5YAY6_9GAMM|nr:TRAP transporter substrate-binding protein DctP [Marinobacter iranensis]MDF0750843.1 TRAP transporter substrate-binding protein DctP [Marinobacter iranensis]
MTISSGSRSWVAIAAGALLSATTASAETTISYATYFNNSDPLVQMDLWFMDEVTKRTDGEVVFETYLGGAMLGGPDIYPGLSRGGVGMGMSVPAGFHPDTYVLTNVTLPYITDNSVAVTYAFNELLAESEPLRQEYEQQNVKLLYGLGFSENLVWSNTPVRTAEDLEGMRIRSIMSIANALEMLGAVPVLMDFGSAVGALQRNVIDGFSSAPFLTSIAVGLQDFAPYVSDAGGMGVYAVSNTGVNMDVWNDLSPEIQQVIEEVVAEIPGHYASVMDDYVEEGVKALHDAGKTEVIMMNEEETDKIRETVSQALWDSWIEKVDASGQDGEAFLARYAELVEQAEASHDYVPALSRYMDQYGE